MLFLLTNLVFCHINVRNFKPVHSANIIAKMMVCYFLVKVVAHESIVPNLNFICSIIVHVKGDKSAE